MDSEIVEITTPDEKQPEEKQKTAEEINEAYKSEPWWYVIKIHTMIFQHLPVSRYQMLLLNAIRYDVRGFFILTFAYSSTLLRQVRFFGKNMGSNHLEVAC